MKVSRFERVMCLPVWAMEKIKLFDFLGPLALRLYLMLIFWVAGMNQLLHLDDTITWFGNIECHSEKS